MKKTLVQGFVDRIDSIYEKQLHKDTSLIQDVCFRIAFGLFGFVVVLFVLASIGFIAHIEINAMYFYVALLLAFAPLFYKNSHKILTFTIFVGLIFVALLMASLYYDASWDGRAYHQIGIYYLANGWNPVYQKMAELTNLEVFLSHEIWVEHYLKFAEITAACIYKVFGFIEIGKAVNYILAFACFLYGVQVLLKLPHITMLRAFLLAFLLVFSPVVFVQINTYYIDGLLACALCMVFLGIIDLEIQPSGAKYALFVFALIATASIKLTGVAYVGFIGLAYLGYKIVCFGLKDSKSLIVSGLASAFIIALCNSNPFFTNIAEGKHPGYPLLGKNKIDIITGQQPQTFKDFTRFEKMFYSLFSKTYNGRDKTEFKVPFVKSASGGIAIDTRVAGFGHYFGGIIILCALFVLIHYKDLRVRPKVFLALALVLFSVFINPESWWARYAPQLWLVPFVLLIASYGLGGDYHKPFRSLFRILTFVFVFMSVLDTARHAYKTSARYTKHIEQIFQGHLESVYFTPKPKMERSFIIKIKERKLDVQILSDEQYQSLLQSGRVFTPIPGLLMPEGYWDMESESKE
ncbi:MAG TPA: hypothetical protein IAA33_07400 [Candidatus Helicobacter avicola]|nr:hypothetical protein [Candidatus Helicobacter avicola]